MYPKMKEELGVLFSVVCKLLSLQGFVHMLRIRVFNKYTNLKQLKCFYRLI